MEQYKIEALIESCLNHKTMINWLTEKGFHTIKCTVSKPIICYCDKAGIINGICVICGNSPSQDSTKVDK